MSARRGACTISLRARICNGSTRLTDDLRGHAATIAEQLSYKLARSLYNLHSRDPSRVLRVHEAISSCASDDMTRAQRFFTSLAPPRRRQRLVRC